MPERAAAAEQTLAELVERSVGVVLDEHGQRRLLPIAGERAVALGLAGIGAYVDHLAQQPIGGPGAGGEGTSEWGRVIASLTNGQTSFFRDAEQLQGLVTLLAARGRPINIWCAACSTGEEAYSMAILTAEAGVPARILATDVNQLFLDAARAGRFDSWTLRNVGAERRARWFEPAGDRLAIKPELRTRVDFQRHNLVADDPRDAGWDLILCRNVFLYFRRERVADTCRRLVGTLAPDGLLAVAVSETLHDLALPVTPEMAGGRIVYRNGPPQSRLPPAPLVLRPPVPARPAPTVTEQAATRAAAGELDLAAQLLDEVPPESRGIADWLAAGHLHLKRHAFAPALDAYRRAGELDPLLAEVHYFEGVVHRKTGAWRRAADALRRALFLAPTFWQASYLLAGCYDRLGLADDTVREHDRTRRLLAELRERGGVAFLSHPVFAAWFVPQADEVQRILRSDHGLR